MFNLLQTREHGIVGGQPGPDAARGSLSAISSLLLGLILIPMTSGVVLVA